MNLKIMKILAELVPLEGANFIRQVQNATNTIHLIA